MLRDMTAKGGFLGKSYERETSMRLQAWPQLRLLAAVDVQPKLAIPMIRLLAAPESIHPVTDGGKFRDPQPRPFEPWEGQKGGREGGREKGREVGRKKGREVGREGRRLQIAYEGHALVFQTEIL